MATNSPELKPRKGLSTMIVDGEPDQDTPVNAENTALKLRNKGGRPKGSKNKDTLFKELMTQDFQQVAKKDILAVYRVLFDKAKNGDMKAIKLVLDRVVPVTKAIDLEELETGGIQININVGEMKTDPALDVDFVEVVG